MTAALTVRLEPDQLEALADLVVERLGSLRRAAAGTLLVSSSTRSGRSCAIPANSESASGSPGTVRSRSRAGRPSSRKMRRWRAASLGSHSWWATVVPRLWPRSAGLGPSMPSGGRSA